MFTCGAVSRVSRETTHHMALFTLTRHTFVARLICIMTDPIHSLSTYPLHTRLGVLYPLRTRQPTDHPVKYNRQQGDYATLN